jgi:hypothetical protein
MSNLSTETIREIFHTIVKIRNSNAKTEETERLKKLAGINEAPLEIGKSLKQRARDQVDRAKGAAREIGRDIKRNVVDPVRGKSTVSYEDIFDVWENSGKPSRTQEIVRLLQQMGFSDREIKKSFQQVGVTSQGESEIVSKLARGIVQRGLQKQVLKYMGEEGLDESILNETAITNKQIKDVFRQIAAEFLPAEESNTDEHMFGRKRKS